MTNNINLELYTQPKSDKQHTHKATYVHTKGLTRKNGVNRSNRRKQEDQMHC